MAREHHRDSPPARPVLRPLLRPGLRTTRRDGTTLQVGLEPPRRVTLPDLAPVRALLAALAVGDDPELASEAARSAWERLLAADLVVDAQCLSAALAAARGEAQRSGVAAAYATFGSDARRRLRQRAETRVALEVPRGDAGDRWRRTLTRLLGDAGVGVAPADARASASLALVATEFEPVREELDRALATGEPHLLLASIDGWLRLGPFVVPGRTACLRCVDAHLGEDDPRRSLVVHQYAGSMPAAGCPAPEDPSLTTLALAWAARDLVAYVDGDRPATWSATVHIGPDLALPRREWTRHPHCGCCWGDLRDVV